VSDIHDLSQYRARRSRGAAPTREPDFVASGWLRDGEVEWLYTDFAGGPDHTFQMSVLLDAAWIAGRDPKAVDGTEPIFWWLLDSAGHNTFLTSEAFFDEPRGARAAWFIRAWWQLTRECAAVVWRLASGA